MMFINLVTKDFPRYEGDIRLEYPNMGDQFVCPSNYAVVEELAQPEFDVSIHNLIYDIPFEENGSWKVGFVVENMPTRAIKEFNKKPSELEQDPFIKAIMLDIEKTL